MALRERHCSPIPRGSSPLQHNTCQQLLAQLDADWTISPDNSLRREFSFQDYYQTMAFANAVAWIAQREDHHPQMTIGYRQVRIDYTTHTAGGLTENDFICAARIDQLLDAG